MGTPLRWCLTARLRWCAAPAGYVGSRALNGRVESIKSKISAVQFQNNIYYSPEH